MVNRRMGGILLTSVLSVMGGGILRCRKRYLVVKYLMMRVTRRMGISMGKPPAKVKATSSTKSNEA